MICLVFGFVFGANALYLQVSCDQQEDDTSNSQGVDKRRQKVVAFVRTQVLSQKRTHALFLPKEEGVHQDNLKEPLKVAREQTQARHHCQQDDNENRQDKAKSPCD